MARIDLTGADFFDLAAGLSFNTVDEHGEEVVLYGDEVSDEQVYSLARGDAVEHDTPSEVYELRASEEPWSGHHSAAELSEIREGPYGHRVLVVEGKAKPTDEPLTPLGPRSRPSGLAAERAGV